MPLHMPVLSPYTFRGRIVHEKHSDDIMTGKDKFKLVHPNANWLAGLEHAEKIGIGTANYELIEV